MIQDKFGATATMTQNPAPVVYAKGEEANTRWGHWIVCEHPVTNPETGKITRCEKHITVNPMASLSGQNHFGRGETYIGLEGVTKVYVNGKIFDIGVGDTVEIPRGSLHYSWSLNGSKFHEIQHGVDCDEADIKRCADKYKTPDQLDSDDDIVHLMMAVAKDRYETEDISRPFDSNDFMPHVVKILDMNGHDFENTATQSALYDFFKSMIDDCKHQHKTSTPNPQQIQQKLVK